MENILFDTLPEYIEIDGQPYQINTDYKNCLRIITAFEDNDLTPQEKQIVLLSNLYNEIPRNVNEAMRQAVIFLNGGEENTDEETPPYRLYSFAKDSRFIYAAFRQTHGIDLTETDLHWWQFLSLFLDLGSETTFSQLISLRKRLKTGKATKEERQAAREMGSIIEVPEIDTRTLDEKEQEAEFMRLIGKR